VYLPGVPSRVRLNGNGARKRGCAGGILESEVDRSSGGLVNYPGELHCVRTRDERVKGGCLRATGRNAVHV
jgi:hypothetical protein